MTILSRRRFLAAPAALSLAQFARAATLAEIPLGITTDEIDDDVATASQFLHEYGLHWAEVRNIWGKYNTALPVDKVREAKAIFDRHQVKTNVLGTGFFKIPLPPDTPQGRGVLDNQWSLLDGAFERAKVLGADKIRVFAFTYNEGEQPDAKNYPRIYELVGEAARRAKARNLRLALENVNSSYVLTGAHAADLLKAVKNDSLGLVWDPNNASQGGETPYPDGFKKLDPARIFHIHLRDFKRISGNKVEWRAVGDGEMDNLGQLRALRKVGFKGSYTLETHYKSPQGRMHATRTSLAGLLKVIEQV